VCANGSESPNACALRGRTVAWLFLVCATTKATARAQMDSECDVVGYRMSSGWGGAGWWVRAAGAARVAAVLGWRRTSWAVAEEVSHHRATWAFVATAAGQERCGPGARQQRREGTHRRRVRSRRRQTLVRAAQNGSPLGALVMGREKCSGKQGGFLVEDAGVKRSKPYPCRWKPLAPALLAVGITNNKSQQHSAKTADPARAWRERVESSRAESKLAGASSTSSRPRSQAFQPPCLPRGTVPHTHRTLFALPRGLHLLHLLHAGIPHSSPPASPQAHAGGRPAVQPPKALEAVGEQRWLVARHATRNAAPTSPKRNARRRGSWPYAPYRASAVPVPVPVHVPMSLRRPMHCASRRALARGASWRATAARYHLNSDSSPPNRSQTSSCLASAPSSSVRALPPAPRLALCAADWPLCFRDLPAHRPLNHPHAP
jgi:hypothetical protein